MENTVAEKLQALYQLQSIDSQIDQIRILRGELPQEVADMEDEVAGLHTRLHKFEAEHTALEKQVSEHKDNIKTAQALKSKYEGQLDNVKNSREFDAINKEIEMQSLEAQISEKRINNIGKEIVKKQDDIVNIQNKAAELVKILEQKRAELDGIIAETEKDEAKLLIASDGAAQKIENRYRSAYTRVRGSMKNGLAVVAVDRNACGGCFSQIPPQTQLEIKARKRILTCENCGRILVDLELAQQINDEIKQISSL
jgi:predicted  nucleic acid-binding Zn-ribbon protein